MTEEQAKTHKHNPFDVTKVWRKADYPLIEVGVMKLNRYSENYFAEVESATSGFYFSDTAFIKTFGSEHPGREDL